MRCDWGSLEMFVFRRCFWIFLIEYERRGDEVEEKETNITHNLNHIHTVFGEMQIDKNKFVCWRTYASNADVAMKAKCIALPKWDEEKYFDFFELFFFFEHFYINILH